MHGKFKKIAPGLIFGLVCFLLGTGFGLFFSKSRSAGPQAFSKQDEILFLQNFVPLYDQGSQQPTSENLARLENTLEPFLFELLKKNLTQKSPLPKLVPLEIHQISGMNPYQVLIEKLGPQKSLQEWTILLQMDGAQKLVSQISIQELKELTPVHQLSLWQDQVMILRAPCSLVSAPLQAEALEVDLDPFSVNQILIRWKKFAETLSNESASLQFQCLDRNFRLILKAAGEEAQHTRFIAVPLSAGEFVRKQNPSKMEKALENELGLDLEEGR